MNTMLNTAFVAFAVVGSCVVFGELVTESNGTAMENLNGKSMFNIGRNLQNPLLMLLGRTLGNIQNEIQGQICDLHPCSEWTEWSACDAKLNEFGAQYRSRKCGLNKVTCKMESESKVGTESKLCVNFCPKDYNVTKHGFCIRLYTDKTRNQDDAETLCQKDGGHLINTDSEQKYSDVSEVIQISKLIWVDRRRKDNHSPWEYKYGANHTISKWHPREPDNGSTELCLVIAKYSSGGVLWNDSPCNSNYYTMCEIPKM